MTTYPKIILTKLSSGRFDQWVVYEDCLCGAQILPDGTVEYITIPEGFVTNLASVPRWLWWLIPPHGESAAASALHDYMYFFLDYYRGVDDKRARAAVDATFLINLIMAPGIKQWQAWLMYQAVRWGGKKYWGMRTKKDRQEN